jgi:hypothetical protein
MEKSLIDIIEYGQFWKLLDKLNPQIQREVQGKYLALEYEESVFNDIE